MAILTRSTGARTFCGRFPAFLPQNQLPPKSSKLLSALSTLNQSPAAVMAFKIQARSHGSSHGHHHHNSSYLTSSNKKDPAVRITRIGLFVNLGMAIGKGIGGYYFNSQALVADAYHAMTDMVSDFTTLATVGWSMKHPTPLFPTGFGKVESLGSLGVSGLLLGGGIMMCLTATSSLYGQFFVEAVEHGVHAHGFGHSHSHTDLGPNINAAWLAGGSVLVKEYLYRATMKVAKQRKSGVLASNAVHHRVDSLTGMVALAAITGSHFISNAAWLDPIGGFLVSLLVIRAGWGNTRAAVMELADVGVDESVKIEIKESIQHYVDETKITINNVQGVKSGPNYLMDVDLAVPQSWTVEQTSKAEEELRDQIGAKVRGVRRLKIRFLSQEAIAADPNSIDEFIAADSQGYNILSTRHDHDHQDHKDEKKQV